MKEIYRFTIPIAPVTKKNSSNIFYNKVTGKRFICPSNRYRQYENDFFIINEYIKEDFNFPIDFPINLEAHYYMPTKRKVDLINLHSALHDCLVKKGIILDDNSNIIVSTDGSRVWYDKDFPKTVVIIQKT